MENTQSPKELAEIMFNNHVKILEDFNIKVPINIKKEAKKFCIIGLDALINKNINDPIKKKEYTDIKEQLEKIEI